MPMPVCLFSTVSIITGLFCCISKSNEFNYFNSLRLKVIAVFCYAQIHDGTKTNFKRKYDGNTKQDNAVGNQGSLCE